MRVQHDKERRMSDPQHETPGEPPTRKAERASFKSRWEFFAYAYARIVQSGKWWLLPVLLALMIVGVVLNMFTSYNILPAVYSLFP